MKDRRVGLLGLLLVLLSMTAVFPVNAVNGLVAPIDVKPMSCPNGYNRKSKGILPVAIGTVDSSEWPGPDFDASWVDPDTVKARGQLGSIIGSWAYPVRWTYEDVDGDGDIDLLFFFKRSELAIPEGCTTLAVYGKTLSDQDFIGTDGLKLVPK